MERRAALITQAQETAQRGVTEDRDLTVEEPDLEESVLSLYGRTGAAS